MLSFEKNRIYKVNSLKNAIMTDDISVSYTYKSDDITQEGRINDATSYIGRKEKFDENGYATLTKSRLQAENFLGGLRFQLVTTSTDLSEFGVNLPFNFMGKKNAGGWKNQFLFNSPFASFDNKYKYCYLTNPNGNNLLIVMEGTADGWKMDYSPYVGGHFFYNLRLLANFDKAFKTNSQNKSLIFSIFEVKDFEDALEKVSKIFGVPVLTYNKNSGKIGEEVQVKVFGDVTHVCIEDEKLYVKGDFTYTIKQEGIQRLIPYFQEKRGLECEIYGYTNLDELYKKSMDAVTREDIAATDGNLCEWQCWASAMLRYMMKYGKNQAYEEHIKELLAVVMEKDENKAVARRTILHIPQKNGLPAYHIYNSTRIQEQFFGVSILLDAYKYWGEEEYLEYAVRALNTLIDVYQKEDGRLERYDDWNGCMMDYTTVCCLIIPIVDMALYFEDKDDGLYQKYKKSAEKMVEYLYNRGLVFPTETELVAETEDEMEDGSISCTALALLYYSAKMKREEKYIQKALEILRIHESWVVKLPIAPAFGSSLRWWETRWEGDADGPALCMGHAWSIWRAEADYWAYYLTKDKYWLDKAWNGFGCNFSKINKKGQSYSIYQVDYITGGGLKDKPEIIYEIAPKYPRQTDSGLSRYVWIRAMETIMLRENSL